MHDGLPMPLPSRLLARLDRIAAEHDDGQDPAHDILHVRRVARASARIAEGEGANVEVVTAAALLHELFNFPKGHPESSRSGEVCAERAREVLESEGAEPALIDAVAYAIRVHPFSLGVVPETLEARVLQDADRIDAIGAIGIARCFATATSMHTPFYAPDDPMCVARTPDDKSWAVDHFFRKLLHIPEVLHTAAAKAMADERMAFMRAYLDQLAREIT